MLSSTRTITTDRRHIDPNPDRLQLISSSAGSASTTTPAVKPASLLLLSTSAEAAVAESKRFERSSRHSSLSNSFGSPPTHSSIKAHHQKLHPSSPPSPSSSSTSSSSALNHHHHRPLNYHHLTHPRNLSQSPLRNHHQQRIHHRFTQAASLQNNHHTPAPPNNNSSSTNNNRREQAKTGQLFKCEKCLKVYRHPQCLVKHRWEHTEYWADASKLMLSKHQQVQMLEAAAILAAPSGSLPESRSLWPAAVSSSEAGLLGSDQVNLEVICSRQAARPTGNPHHHYRSSSTSCVLSRESRENTDIEMNEDRGPQGLVGHERRSAAAEDQPEDEIMFEMSLDGEESSYSNARHTGRAKQRIPERGGSVRSSSISSSVSGPPPIGYFERRNPQSVSSVISNLGSLQRSSSSTSAPKGSRLVASLPAMVAYQPALDTHNQANQFVYHASESIFKPMAPYQDSQLRFEGRRHFHPDLVDEDQFPPATLATAPASTGKSNSKPSTEDDSTTEEEDAEDDDDGWSPSTERERERVEGDEVIGMEL